MTLKPLLYHKLAISDVKPQGWLKRQLEIQAEGLSGNLDLFWPDVQRSAWIGGDGEEGERLPYWLDGFIPLAFLLEREDLIARARGYINTIISNQKPDGWLMPTPIEEANPDWHLWSTFLMLKVFVVWHDATGDERMEEVIYQSLQSVDKVMKDKELQGWSRSRWFEALISIFWIYERRPEQWLMDLASKITDQGFDWAGYFENWPLKKVSPEDQWAHESHVVNNAMMLKAPALKWRMTGKESDLNAIYNMLSQLDEFHGMVTGIFSGDECISGNSPAQGTELCAVAETMYSLQHLIAATGDPAFSDRLERITYNCLPATISPDMWTHQYDQQPNQMQCSEDITVWLTNDPDSNLFGLEPNYGCCTANMHQAWPKFVSSLCMKSDKGLAITAWAPMSLNTTVNGTAVSLEIVTDYPFKNTAKVVLKSSEAVSFPLELRIPCWTVDATICYKGATISPVAGKYYTLDVTVDGETEIDLTFPMVAKVLSRPNSLYAIERGPLVYSLKIGEDWRQIHQDVPGREFPHCDWEIYATTPWNYAFCIDPEAPELIFEEKEVSDVPFSPEGAPVVCRTYGCQISWELVKGTASPTPSGEVIGEKEEITLIPYGCTNLRMTELPIK